MRSKILDFIPLFEVEHPSQGNGMGGGIRSKIIRSKIGETGIRTNEKKTNDQTEIGLMEIGLILFSAALELMEIGLIEIGLKLLACKVCNYVDQIDKITTCSIVNIEHKSSTTKKAEADKNVVQNKNWKRGT